uniref:Kinase n=1 Tax=Kryptolebias marmoratus TaxID=37003 RepID=A0A3Q2ZGT9_KRYMA
VYSIEYRKYLKSIAFFYLYLKLEDVTSRFVRPCIMDVKLGQRSYDPFASQEKREQQIRKYPLMEDIGFLILGMRVYNVQSDAFDTFNQHYGRSLVKDTVKDGLAKFFHNGLYLRKDAIWASVHRVRQILHWFNSQHQLAFYASSLLFVYEGLPSSSSPSSLSTLLRNPSICDTVMKTHNNNTEEATNYTNQRKKGYHLCGRAYHLNNSVDYGERKSSSRTEEEEEEEEEGLKEHRGRGPNNLKEVEVRMIDFAHVFPSDSHDHGYIYGLKHLLTVLEQILADNERSRAEGIQ